MKNIVRFQIFEQFPGLTCAVVGRPLGVKTGFDENYQIYLEENLKKIIEVFRIATIKIMHQVHGVDIHECSLKEARQIFKQTDGLLTTEKGIFLLLKTADCVPIFLFEPSVKIVMLVHGGWRGILNDIVGRAISHIVRHGGRAENIFVGLGPYIRDCCYSVDEERFVQFKSVFPNFNFEKRNFLDLGRLCAFQMSRLGIPQGNIEMSEVCTACNYNNFYSYRAGSGGLNNVGIIGMIN